MASREREAEFIEYIAAKGPWLRRVAFLLCQDWYRADDLVQSTLTRLYIDWPKVSRARHQDAYVRAALVNCYLAEQRTSWWRRVTLHGEPEDANPPAPAPDCDLRMDLGSALAAIPPRQRTTLVLRFYCDLSVQETAELMSCSTGNVKSQTSHGLAALRRILGTAPAFPEGARP